MRRCQVFKSTSPVATPSVDATCRTYATWRMQRAWLPSVLLKIFSSRRDDRQLSARATSALRRVYETESSRRIRNPQVDPPSSWPRHSSWRSQPSQSCPPCASRPSSSSTGPKGMVLSTQTCNQLSSEVSAKNLTRYGADRPRTARTAKPVRRLSSGSLQRA